MNYQYESHGKGGISAKTVAASRSFNGQRILTMELEFPRFLLAQFNTHRMFSRNAASSRAIPTSKLIRLIKDSPAMPIHWGKNQPGMSAKEECNASIGEKSREKMWKFASSIASDIAEDYSEAGYHKQIVNRLVEPFQFIKVIVTATEFDNFFTLRDHEDAQPEIAELAKCMRECYDQSEYMLIGAGEWHTPYVNRTRSELGELRYSVTTEDGETFIDEDTALKVSASCCAQVSYRNLDQSVEKATMIFDKLVSSFPGHWSPFESVATPMEIPNFYCDGFFDQSNYEGITHINHETGEAWSSNFNGFIQLRKLLDVGQETD